MNKLVSLVKEEKGTQETNLYSSCKPGPHVHESRRERLYPKI